MSTSGSFTPPAAPPCPYPERMTRAAALALRTAGTLSPDCVITITDGPTIGTTGNTSPTEVTLQPVSATEFADEALVHTTFSPNAWQGRYNIDLGTGSIQELTDDWGNVAKDIDSGGATVETQFPWHLGSATLRDNYAEDATLTGWDTQVGSLINNRVINSVVDLTGKPSGNMTSNTFTDCSVILGAGGGSVAFTRSQIFATSSATTVISHTGSGAVNYSDATQRDQFAVSLTGTGSFTAQDVVLQNHSTATFDIAHAGGGALTIIDGVITAPYTGVAFDVQTGTTGTVGIQRSNLSGCHVSKVTGSSGPLTMLGDDLQDSTVVIGAANAATVNNINNTTGQFGNFQLLGPVAAPARNDFTAGLAVNNALFTVAATATAGLGVQGGDYNSVGVGGVVQNRTAGTNSTTLFGCKMRGFSTFTDNGTVDPGVGTSFNRLDLTDSSITVGNVTGKTGSGPVLQQADLMGSTLTLTGPNGAAFLNRVRLWGASLTNAGFDGSDLIIDGAFTHTMGATQSNRLMNVSYSNWT